MRKIKFRAWDSVAGVMYEPFELGEILSENTLVNMGKHYQYLQFTGLLDRNGKEIYEGDIVGEEDVYHFLEREGWAPKDGNWKIIGEKTENFTGKGEEKYIAGYKLKTVEWVKESCGFEPFSDSIENCQHCGGGCDSNYFEIIGNIYEDPHLLTENK